MRTAVQRVRRAAGPKPARERELRGLLAQPSLATSIEAAAGSLVAWCTPSLRPGVGDPLELSVSTADLRVPGDERLGTPGAEDGPFGRAGRLAALAFGAEHAILGVNGSSGHNQVVARVVACTPGAHVLMPLNAHHSLLDALIDLDVPFSRIRARYLPDLEAMLPPAPEDVRAALDAAPGPVTAVVLSSPTYEGLDADVAAIAEIAHAAGAALVVDAAWGAHAPFLRGGGPIAPGADLVVTSTHKTAGARQQTALLLQRDGRIPWSDVVRAHATVATTSPSYPLLADIDATVRWLLTDGEQALEATARRVRRFAGALRRAFPALEVLGGTPDVDPLRVTVGALHRHGQTGHSVAAKLAEAGIAVEKCGVHAVTFLAPLGLGDEDVRRTLAALPSALRFGCSTAGPGDGAAFDGAALTPSVRPARAVRALAAGEVDRLALRDAVGRIAAHRVELYPPGIPLVLPGFRITAGVAAAIASGSADATILSTAGPWDGRVSVLRRHGGQS